MFKGHFPSCFNMFHVFHGHDGHGHLASAGHFMGIFPASETKSRRGMWQLRAPHCLTSALEEDHGRMEDLWRKPLKLGPPKMYTENKIKHH